jgi:RNA polymerase sigma-70 factor, ECF subfamily
VFSSVYEDHGEEPLMEALSDSLVSDQILLEQLAQGRAASFDALFLRHYDRVYGLLFRLVGNRAEAEDLAQEAFIRLHIQAKNDRLRRDEDNVGAWLYRVSLNLGYNALRAQKRRWQHDVHLVPAETSGNEVEKDVARREERRVVREVLKALPKRQAQLLVLRQMDFSYAECAEICKVAPGSVGKLLARAADSFRREYNARLSSQARHSGGEK